MHNYLIYSHVLSIFQTFLFVYPHGELNGASKATIGNQKHHELSNAWFTYVYIMI